MPAPVLPAATVRNGRPAEGPNGIGAEGAACLVAAQWNLGAVQM